MLQWIKKWSPRRILIPVLLLTAAVLMILFWLLALRLLANVFFVSEYQKGSYHEKTEQAAAFLFPADRYVLYYNIGNAQYMRRQYPDAIASYTKALSCDLPAGKECAVRINLVLAQTRTIDFAAIDRQFAALQSQGQQSQGQQSAVQNSGQKEAQAALVAMIRNAIRNLQRDRSYLTADGCAHDADNGGHSPEAESLKTDLDTEIAKLQEMLKALHEKPEPADTQDSEEQEEKQKSGETASEASQTEQQPSDGREDAIRKRIEAQQQEAMEERGKTQRRNAGIQEEEEQETTAGTGEDVPSYDGKTW